MTKSSPAAGTAVATADILKGTTITTINAKQFLTISGDEKANDNDSRDQKIDYSGISFFKTNTIVTTDNTIPTPEQLVSTIGRNSKYDVVL